MLQVITNHATKDLSMIICLATRDAIIRQRPAFCLERLAAVAGHKKPLWACAYLLADLSVVVCLAPCAAVNRQTDQLCVV